MVERPRKFRAHPFALALGVALGALGGLGYAKAQPQLYEAGLTLHFPSTDREMFRQILQAVSSDSASNETLNLVSSGQEGGKRVDVAREIFFSRAATARACEASGLRLSAEQRENFRVRNLTVEVRSGNVLALEVRDRRSETARTLCQNYLDYYEEFVRDQALTHTGKVRQSLEKRYLAMAAQVRKLEVRLLSAEELKRRRLGDSLVAQSESTRALLARGREQEEALSRESLERLRKLRTELQVRQPGELPGADPWTPPNPSQNAITATLSQEKVTADRYKDDPPPPPAEVVKRAQLERNYEDTVALHRILLLQHGILRTLEELEELDFKIIDPLSVHPVSRSNTLISYAVLGGLLALLLEWLVSLLGEANSDREEGLSG